MTLDDALNDFVRSIQKPIRESGKTPVVWQEMVNPSPSPSLLRHQFGEPYQDIH